jgi:hypothetical protein
LGAKYLVVLCAGSALLLVQSKALDKAPYKLSGAVAKLAYITFKRLAFSWTDKPWFLTKGKFAAILIIPPLGVPNWTVIYINTSASSTHHSPFSTLENFLHTKLHTILLATLA